MGRGRKRLDALLAERGLFASAAEAARAILAGEVRVAGEVARSAGMQVKPDAHVEVAAREPFVSRGGRKLQQALDAFSFDPSGMRCLDCGASTGGFTDCLLQAGAAHVCAVDVGYGQFAWSLRCDPRVTLFERTNIRLLDREQAGAPFDLAVADISFAPLRTYLDAVVSYLTPAGVFIDLVKPQFEAAKHQVDSGGVVRDRSVHVEVVARAISQLEDAGFAVCGLTYSPITGREGNIEYLVMGALSRDAAANAGGIDVEAVVAQADNLLRS